MDVKGSGMNTHSLVEEAIKYKDENKLERGDQLWVVFDRDDFPEDNIRKAFDQAKKNGIRCAYSNQAFELWFLLHFDYHDAALHRSQYKEKLSEKLDRDYKKNDARMYRKLLDKQDNAIRNAQKLHNAYVTFDPIRNDPVTTVYELVMELNRLNESTRRDSI